MPYHRSDYKPFHNAIIPENFNKMSNYAELIAKHISNPFVRIDLYSINRKIYFSEITFSPCSGMVPFEPKEADFELGKMIRIKNNSISE